MSSANSSSDSTNDAECEIYKPLIEDYEAVDDEEIDETRKKYRRRHRILFDDKNLLRKPFVHTSLTSSSASGVLTSCYCFCCCSFLFMITFIILALTISGRALCSSEPMRMHEELLINSTVLGQFFGTVEVTAEDNTLASSVNVSGYVVNATPDWEDTNLVDHISITNEIVKLQDYVSHSFRLVNRSRVLVDVRTARVEGSGVGNLSAAFFFLDEDNYVLYQSGSNYTPVDYDQEGIESLQRMPSVFSSTLIANESAALYYAILENNDYIDMIANWSITVERTKFNISSVPVSSSCSYIMNKTDPKKEDDAEGQTQTCELNVTGLKDYFVVISTNDLTNSNSTNDGGRLIISSRGVFLGGWRFGMFGILAVLSALLFFFTCFVALCYKRPSGTSAHTTLITSEKDEPLLPVLQGSAPKMMILQPSPPPSSSA